MSRIAVVHDYFIQMGGAEKVAEEFHAMFPGSDMHSTVDRRRMPGKASWLQSLPVGEKNHRLFFLAYPFAVESMDMSDYDLILSSSSGYAKGVSKRKGAVHVCYCHTPMRWVWRFDSYAEREQFGGLTKALLPIALAGLKQWDLRASKQPDYYIANSHTVAERIKKFYGRDSIVIPPPIDVDRFAPEDVDEDYFLVLSRLASYKRIDVAVEAFKKLDMPLVIIGDGPDRARLERLAGPKTRFLGRQPDEVVNRYAARCRALIFPGEEDFGMVPLEINAAGRPVIAFKAGGATETVVDGRTGLFFGAQTPDSLAEAVEKFSEIGWDKDFLRNHAMRFDRSVFENRVKRFLDKVAPMPISVPSPAPLTAPTGILAKARAA